MCSRTTSSLRRSRSNRETNSAKRAACSLRGSGFFVHHRQLGPQLLDPVGLSLESVAQFFPGVMARRSALATQDSAYPVLPNTGVTACFDGRPSTAGLQDPVWSKTRAGWSSSGLVLSFGITVTYLEGC